MDLFDLARANKLSGGSGGGGGGGGMTLVTTKDHGTINTASTSETDLNVSLNIDYTTVSAYDALVVVCCADTVVDDCLVATVDIKYIYGNNDITNKNASTSPTGKLQFRMKSGVMASSSSATTAYGIYSKVTTSDGAFVFKFYSKYASATGTINNHYTAKIYGANLYDLI